MSYQNRCEWCGGNADKIGGCCEKRTNYLEGAYKRMAQQAECDTERPAPFYGTRLAKGFADLDGRWSS